MCSVVIALMQKNRREMRKEGLDMETIGFTVYEVREGELLFFFSFYPVMPFHSGRDALSLKCCAKVYVGIVTIKKIGRRCHRRNTAEIFFFFYMECSLLLYCRGQYTWSAAFFSFISTLIHFNDAPSCSHSIMRNAVCCRSVGSQTLLLVSLMVL